VEPNDGVTNAQAVTAPFVLNGHIGAAKDIDQVRFKSGTDQKLVCEVAAGRFGSKLDALLTLSDTNGTVLQRNDDANGADARLEFDAKKDTEYFLALRDLIERGGDRYGYRVSVRPPSVGAAASFVARFLPDASRVNRGGTTRIRCEVTRAGGFDGPVRVAFADLPSGVFAEPLVMPNAPASGILLLSATKEAPLGSFPIRLTASGVIGGKTVTVTAEPLNGDRVVKQAYLTVLGAVPFTLELATLSASPEQNQSATVEVVAQRAEGFTGDIKIVAEGFSAGREPITKSFDGAESLIKGADAVGKLTLKPKMDSEVGTRTVVVRGEAMSEGRQVVTYTRPMPITVTQYPLILSSTLPRLSLTVLPPGTASAAGEAETKIKVERRAGFKGDVELEIEGLPEGIKSELGKLPEGVAEAALKLTVTEKAVVGTNYSFRVVGRAVFNDHNYKARTGKIALTVSAPEAPPVQVVTNAPPASALGPSK
jgi:hypothetical protein